MDFLKKVVATYETEWLTSFYFEKNAFFYIEKTYCKWFINPNNYFK